jgi:hypothetical protein
MDPRTQVPARRSRSGVSDPALVAAGPTLPRTGDELGSTGSTPPALQLPALYRRILDAIAVLERTDRREAIRVRRRASSVYSGAWDDEGRRRLEAILAHLGRLTDAAADARSGDRSRGWLLRRRPTEARPAR